MPTLAVTGASGHLGGLVADRLLAHPSAPTVVALVRDADKAAALAQKGADVREADYADPQALETALAGVDTLLLVSSNAVGQRFAQHQNVIDAAVRAGVGRIVYTSAPHATTSALVLAPEHKATEEYLAASGVPFTVLRNNWYHENYADQIATARATGTLVGAAGDGRVASASRADYADAAVAVLTASGHEGQVYELAGDTAWTYDDLAAALSEAIGAPVSYQRVDGPTLVDLLKGAGLPEETAGFVAALDENIADGALADNASGDLRRLIGRPTTPLVDVLRGLASA